MQAKAEVKVRKPARAARRSERGEAWPVREAPDKADRAVSPNARRGGAYATAVASICSTTRCTAATVRPPVTRLSTRSVVVAFVSARTTIRPVPGFASTRDPGRTTAETAVVGAMPMLAHRSVRMAPAYPSADQERRHVAPAALTCRPTALTVAHATSDVRRRRPARRAPASVPRELRVAARRALIWKPIATTAAPVAWLVHSGRPVGRAAVGGPLARVGRPAAARPRAACQPAV